MRKFHSLFYIEGLLGENSAHTAQIHMIYDCVQDVFNARVKIAFCKDETEKVNTVTEIRMI